MISFKISTGRSSNRSGPWTAFSLPFGALSAASLAGAAITARAGTLAFHAASTSPWVAVICASFGEGVGGLAGSSEGKGDAVLVVPGVDGGDESMLDGRSVGCRRHLPSRW